MIKTRRMISDVREKCAYCRDMHIAEVCELLRCVYWKDVCIRGRCVVYWENVCIERCLY